MLSNGGGGKVSFFLTFQRTSPKLTYQMMDSINFRVNEIVLTCDSALTYTYIHLVRKARDEELGAAIDKLSTTHGVLGSNIFGYDTINSNSVETCELIEDHPGFKMLVQHEATSNGNFHRWTAQGYSGINCGYSLLKNKLLAKQSSGGEEGGGLSTDIGGGVPRSEEGGEEEESSRLRLSSNDDNNNRSKRQRTGEPGGGGGMVSLDAMMDKMSATLSSSLSSVVAAAITSSGSAAAMERESARAYLIQEQGRREKAEKELQELRVDMEQRLMEQERVLLNEKRCADRRLQEELEGLCRAKVGSYYGVGIHD